MSTVKTKRIYSPPEESDGYRILVDRLWPRGISKQNAKIDHWLKNIAPVGLNELLDRNAWTVLTAIMDCHNVTIGIFE